jgi:hypothetical protein
VIERIAKEEVARVEGIVEAPADARIEESSHPLKEVSGARPGHVVEVPGDDDGRISHLFDFFGDHQQLGIPHVGILALVAFVLVFVLPPFVRPPRAFPPSTRPPPLSVIGWDFPVT